MCLPTIKHLDPLLSQRRQRRSNAIWLLVGPLIGGVVTHVWDLSILRHHDVAKHYSSDIIYAAEFAPRLDDRSRRRKRSAARSVSLDDWTRDETENLARVDHSDLPPMHERLRSRARQDNSDIPNSNEDSNESEDDCIPMHEWQTTHHPMCNYLHELDFHTNFRTGDLEYIDSGGFNDLFHYVTHETYHDIIMERDIDGNLTSVLESTKEFAIKILSLETKAYTPHNYQIVRQDAVIQERLTASSYIFPIYGYCGFALVLPFVSGGTLSSNLRKWRKGTLEISSKQRLRYAVEMARGLRDLHDIDGDGVPSVTHGDLKEQQYLVTEDGGLQLGDFNKGQFLTKHESTGETCPYVNSRGQNDKVFRSPEEYAYKPQDAASDVWALGSLMYYLLTGARVWRDLAETHTDRVRRYIIEGKRPEIDERILKSKDPVDQALKKAYDMACVYNIEERASAKEVSAFLDAVWEELGY